MIKRILIPANQVGLVFKNEQLTDILSAGKHWIVGFDTIVHQYKTTGAFLPSQELNVLLQHAELAAMLDVFELTDNEIGLLYRDGNYAQLLTAGKFAFWKGLNQYTVVKANLNDLYVGDEIDKNLAQRGAFGPYVRTFWVEAHERGILIVDGAVVRTLAPGTYYFWKSSSTVSVLKVDMRLIIVDIPGQEVLTRDKAQLRINFTVQYRVADLMVALADIREYEKQFYSQMQMALREIVGQLTFDELMENKDQIAAKVLAASVEKAAKLGLELVDFGVKDIILPGEMKDIMNQVLIAEKRAQANVIMRREETASTRSLMNTAKLMEENTMLFKLKEMEYVEKIAEKIHTITLSGGSQVVDQLKALFVK